MELHITPKEQILRELEVIQACEEETISEEVSKVIEYGQTLAPYISRSGKLLADAKHHLNTRMKEDTFDALRKTAKQGGATAKAINAIVDSLCAEERYLVDFAERVNRCGVHRLDWCRTLISKAKEDMRLSGMQPT
ncbi:hypothetical protein T231_03350 [Tannerella sp. oral taxon BU063 isolate Cell 6/7/9]|jgi:hypothetical protein|uniref:Uncharacterized protein n=3 Tax=Tannerella serpentiformis TaxID=712710 RepID=W2CWG5_9BACT|nr:hypothetical protein T231_03350 [Tannerella sp. oral taxon BU063 isolate Cell 6/7/9]ETK11506.1 hypothetical protein T235_14975 [Tannerella sp. oral taxon BU063 isolate Cell 8/11]ETK11524.1 hypothetical protein T235_14950 [Tannerella sp. oral taxon BU063 isolate Cell 8/11]DAP95323.1 MAG TPA: hypothetical protein [Caudoviricetes sp.]DAW12881.1 MAG TPA: hypothetical protein [Caudoviricetes sp.]